MAELKPCPFCGGRAFRYHRKEPFGDSYRVYCGNEDCCVQPQTHAYFKKEQAENAWNRRYVPTAEVEFDYAAEDGNG